MSSRVHDARGASLAGLLVIVVVLGGLTAATIIGVNAMSGSDTMSVGPTSTSTIDGGGGDSAGVGLGAPVAQAAAAACKTANAAAAAASAAYYANRGGKYPTRWSDLTAGSPPVFVLPAHVAINASKPGELDGNGWKLVMLGRGATAPAFSCTTTARA